MFLVGYTFVTFNPRNLSPAFQNARSSFSKQLNTRSKPGNCDNYDEASTLTGISEPGIVRTNNAL